MPDLHTWITQQVDTVEALARSAEHGLWEAAQEGQGAAATALRRCEADRQVLARHHLDPDVTYEPACKGCGTYGYNDLSNVDNLNDCPELLTLAHAHGITPEQLARLDRPHAPERPTNSPPSVLLAALGFATPTSGVPAGLRGPNWQPPRGGN